MSDQTNPEPERARVVVVGPDGVAMETDAAEASERPVTEMVEQPAKVMRVGSMIRQLLEEVRAAPLDEKSRARLKEIHKSSIKELEDGLAPELVEELERLSLPFAEDEVPSEAELRVAQAQLVGWLEGLFHGIQTTLFAQQMAARAQLENMRRALPPGMVPGQMVPGQMPGARRRLAAARLGALPLARAAGGAGPAPDGQRASHVDELAGPVHLGPPVAAGRAVRERDLDLRDPHALAEQVDREPGLHAESRRERPRRLERGAGQAALPVERLGRTPSGGAPDAGAGQRDHEAVAALLHPVAEDRDRHVRPAGPHRLDQRGRPGSGLGQVAVEEQQVTRRGTALGRSSRRTASAPVSIAAPLPRLRACRITDAPASCAAAAVPSVDPSSTTITMSTPGRPAAARTVAAIRSDSFRAGMMTATSPLGGTMARS